MKLYKSNIIVENSVLEDIITKLDNDSNTCFIHLGISQPPSFYNIFTYNDIDFRKLKHKFTNILLYIDYNNNGEYIIKCIKKIKKECKKYNISLGTNDNKKIVGFIFSKNEISKYDQLITSINAILIDDKKYRYEYLYDSICKYLDNEFINKDICGFSNDKCIAKKDLNKTMGCCYNFKNKRLGMLGPYKPDLCEYMHNKKCSADCISCKLYTCDYLRKRGIKYTTNSILMIKCFFNPIQKLVVTTSFFKTKQNILSKLILFG